MGPIISAAADRGQRDRSASKKTGGNGKMDLEGLSVLSTRWGILRSGWPVVVVRGGLKTAGVSVGGWCFDGEEKVVKNILERVKGDGKR